MATSMIMAVFENGKVTRYDDHSVGDAFGESLQGELDINLDDLSDGIWLTLRHDEPIWPERGDHSDADPRGLRCRVMADAFYQIMTKEESEKLQILYLEGKPWVVRFDGELVNVGKLTVLADILGTVKPQTGSVFGLISAVAESLEEAGFEAKSTEELAAEMGIPVKLLRSARGEFSIKMKYKSKGRLVTRTSELESQSDLA